MPGERLQIREQVPLAPLTTFGIGGSARFFATVRTEQELDEAVRFAREAGLPMFVLGGGSNLLISDAGFPGLVIQIGIAGEIGRSRVDGREHRMVPAGVSWEDLVDEVNAEGLSGIECLAGIPGLTGGTPVQNVGAYGQEVAETIHSVRALDLRSDTMVELPRAACGFGYRRSIFNSSERGRYVVTAVQFRFDPAARPKLLYAELASRFAGQTPTPGEVSRVVRKIRRGKGMLLVEGDPDCRSAGSFFKNPLVSESAARAIADGCGLAFEALPHWPTGDNAVKLSAAWLLERAGFTKGYELGRVGISSRHSLALINRGGASFGELCALRARIRDEVRLRFGIALEQEPVELAPLAGPAFAGDGSGLKMTQQAVSLGGEHGVR